MNNFLIVRFSIKTHLYQNQMWANANKKIEEMFPERESWFKYRATLFNETYQSFLYQTDPIKKIFLIFDEDDYLLYEKYILPKFDIIPVFDKQRDWKATYTKNILNTCSTNVVLSRVDSDDLIDKHYIENINDAIIKSKKNNNDLTVIAPCGKISDGVHYQEILWNVSPFISLYCPHYREQDVYSESHMLSLKGSHVFTQHAQWTQRIHGTNVDNKFLEERPGFNEIASVLFNEDANGELMINTISTPFLNVGAKQKI